MALKFYSNDGARPNDRPYVTTDKQGRIYINRLAQKEMNALELPIELYVAYDAEERAIGFTQNKDLAPEGTKPFRFNGSRAYASAKGFLYEAQILPKPHEDAHRYFFDRQEGEIFIFVRDRAAIENSDAPDGQTTIDEILIQKEDAAALETYIEETTENPNEEKSEEKPEVPKPELSEEEIREKYPQAKNSDIRYITALLNYEDVDSMNEIGKLTNLNRKTLSVVGKRYKIHKWQEK